MSTIHIWERSYILTSSENCRYKKAIEQTDHGIVLTYNAAVAGEGPKFARTAFPVIAKEVGTVSGDFYLYRVDKDKTPQLLRTLFAAPQLVAPPYHPFETQYDTYLLRFEDICG